MRLDIDFKAKTITIIGQAPVDEVNDAIKRVIGKEKGWHICSKVETYHGYVYPQWQEPHKWPSGTIYLYCGDTNSTGSMGYQCTTDTTADSTCITFTAN